MAIYKRGRRVEEGSTVKQIQLVRAGQSKSVGRVLNLCFFFSFLYLTYAQFLSCFQLMYSVFILLYIQRYLRVVIYS